MCENIWNNITQLQSGVIVGEGVGGHGKNAQPLLGSRPTNEPSGHTLTSWVQNIPGVGELVGASPIWHNPGTHSGQHEPGLIIAVSFALHVGSAHLTTVQSWSSTHFGQHSPAGVTLISPIPHIGSKQSINEQSGLQNGCVNSAWLQNLNVQNTIPFKPQPHVLQPSKNPPFGHVSHEIHGGSTITGVITGDGVGNSHNPGWHTGQHSPGGTTTVSSGPHIGSTHNTVEQSGLQNGGPGFGQNFSVHIALPFTHVQSLHPSL